MTGSKRKPTLKPVPVHAFQSTGETDGRPVNPQEICHCGSPRSHRRHDLPETPADAAALEARKLGEQSE